MGSSTAGRRRAAHAPRAGYGGVAALTHRAGGDGWRVAGRGSPGSVQAMRATPPVAGHADIDWGDAYAAGMSRMTRQRLAIASLVVAAVLVVVEFVALAVGQLVIASACAAVFVVGWFVVRAVFGRPPNDESNSTPRK